MGNFQSTKLIELGSCAFRQPNAKSHCRWLHGYRLQSKLWFGCNELDNNNWVVDFGALKGLKKKFEKQFDHTTCISATDSSLSYFKDLANEDICDLRVMDGVGIEKFAEWCFETADSYIKGMTNGRCWVDRVEVWEHEKNSAAYTRSIDNIETYTTIIDSEPEERLDPGEPLKKPEKNIVKKDESNQIPGQHKTTNKWVDPKVANKPNSWLF